MDGGMDGGMDGRTDGGTEGGTDGSTFPVKQDQLGQIAPGKVKIVPLILRNLQKLHCVS